MESVGQAYASVPELQAKLGAFSPHKVYELQRGEAPRPLEITRPSKIADFTKRLGRAHFTNGKTDQEAVLGLYVQQTDKIFRSFLRAQGISRAQPAGERCCLSLLCLICTTDEDSCCDNPSQPCCQRCCCLCCLRYCWLPAFGPHAPSQLKEQLEWQQEVRERTYDGAVAFRAGHAPKAHASMER